MRYVRFLKTPYIIEGKDTSKPQVQCLITITSDLGDSFLPYDVALFVELRAGESEEIITSRTVQWTAGMRDLSIKLPYRKQRASSSLRIRIGVDSKSSADRLTRLLEPDTRGVVSAWSSPLDLSSDNGRSEKLVERRISVAESKAVCIWEETGESIARHLWDAGISFTAHFLEAFDKGSHRTLSDVFSLWSKSEHFRVLELGAGCGLFGISVAQNIKNTEVLMTDLPDAKDITTRNLRNIKSKAKGSTVNFQELNWDDDLPDGIRKKPFDVAIATDCTYNPDSSPALVHTMQRLAKISPNIYVIVAMKIRHTSEDVFFDLMSKAKFQTKSKFEIELPGDDAAGEETVWVHLFVHQDGNHIISSPN